jgi:ubiquinone/menaquinone biosynthesis C-methylase UbiE
MQQNDVAAQQFGVAAHDYLTSAVHANGPDLVALANAVPKNPTANVLDLGCGAGHASYAVAPHVGAVHAYDIAAAMLDVVARTARERGLHNIHVHQGAAESLPFADASFDTVISRLSAHHWRNVSAALREARRVLKPTGKVILIDAIGSADPLLDTHLQAIELLRDRSHVRDYSVSEWQRMFAAAGFMTSQPHTWRIHIEFTSWIARMRTPPEHVAAIQKLWREAPREVLTAFEVQADGSFELDALLLEATCARSV